MAIDYQKIKNWKFDDMTHTYTERDSMLYALGLGFGANPVDEDELKFVYEKNLHAVPTMGVVLAAAFGWARDPATGINYTKVVHGEQSLLLHKPLPTSGTLIGKTHVSHLIDKGADKGAVIYQARELFDQKTGDKLATLQSATFARGDGGFGKSDEPPPAAPATPEGKPDAVCDFATLPQAALIYRLSGDYNPLHAEPAIGKAAGFKMPILHGRATFSVVGHALVKSVCGYDPLKLKSMSGRFSSPVYPGETIRTEMWVDGNVVAFRATVPTRGVTVLNNGRAEIS